MKTKWYSILPAFFVACSANAVANQVYNSSFELGNAGWISRTYFDFSNITSEYPNPVSFPEGDSVSGKRALRIETRPEIKQTIVAGHNFPVKKNTDYTVSFSIKRVQPGVKTFFLDLFSSQRQVRYDAEGRPLPDTNWNDVSKDTYHQVGRTQINPPDQWTRYSCTFNTGNFTAYRIRIYLGGAKSGAVLLDDIQVEEGTYATNYAPRAPMELVIRTEEHLYEAPEEIKGKVTAVSYDSDLKQKIDLTMFDDFYDSVFAKQSVDLNMKKGEIVSVPFTFKGKIPYGSYQIYSSLQPRITDAKFVRDWTLQAESLGFNRIKADDESGFSAAKFVAVPHPNPKTEDGFRLGTTGSYTPREDKYALNRYGTTRDHLRMIRLAGGNVHRVWDGAIALWKTVEPEKGKFDWRQTDYEMEQAEKTGTDVLCVIGGMFSDRTGKDKYLPKWVRENDLSGNGNGLPVPKNLYFGKVFKCNRFRPPISDWRAYVSAVAARYKGRIKFYEILNESNLYMDAAMYMEYMKAASEEIRKADPDAKILGLCSTSDFGVEMHGFVGQTLKLGADKYMDHITIHPYAKLDNSLLPTQIDERHKLLGAMKKAGVKAKLWNGENYFTIPAWMPATDYAGRVLPEDLARHLIIDMGEGCSGSTATHFQTLTSEPGRGLMTQKGEARIFNIPDARFAAHAATAHFIAGAKPIAPHYLQFGALAYTFRREGKLYTAIWNSRVTVPTEMNVPPMPHKVYDMMANPYEVKGRLPLNAQPWYIEWGEGVKAEEVIAWMNEKPLHVDFAFLIERAVIGWDGDASRLVFAAKNLTGKEVDRKFLSADSPAFKAPCKQMYRKWKDFSDFIFSMPVEVKEKGKIDVTFTAKDFPEFKLTRPVVQTGMVVLGPAPYKTEITKAYYGKPSSPEDLSATMELHATMKGSLWLTVDVKDDKKAGSFKNGWDSDSIELFVDFAPFSGDPEKYNSRTRHLTFKRNVKKQTLNRISCEITDREDGYTAKIRIPVKYDDAIGLEVAVNDSDGEHRKCQLVWSGTDQHFKDRSGFKLIRITPAFNSRVDIPVRNSEKKLLHYNVRDNAGRDWTPHSFTVMPEHDRKLPLVFMSGFSWKEQYPAEYRRIKVTGGTLRNGNFSKRKADGTPKEWRFKEPSGIRMENGEIVLRSIHDFPCKGYIDAKAGVPVTVSYESRMLVK